MNLELTEMFNRNYKRQYGDFKFDLIIDFISNDPEQSLTYACSNSKNAIIINEETQPKVYNQFNKIYRLSEFNIKNICDEIIR